jgi:hypothetical protein
VWVIVETQRSVRIAQGNVKSYTGNEDEKPLPIPIAAA